MRIEYPYKRYIVAFSDAASYDVNPVFVGRKRKLTDRPYLVKMYLKRADAERAAKEMIAYAREFTGWQDIEPMIGVMESELTDIESI